MAEKDKQMMMRDQIYQKQEVTIANNLMSISAVQQQVDELAWLNSENEGKYAAVVAKNEQKKKKIKQERVQLSKKYDDMVLIYENYITKLQKIMKRDHDIFQNQLEFTEVQVDLANA